MSLSKIETLEISTPSVPPGYPKLFRQRLGDLGFRTEVDRDDLKELCGSESAANQFLAKASKMGTLVPKAWGRYVVASKETIQLLARIGHASLRRFVSWTRHLPELTQGKLLFTAPYLWQETNLNIDRPMPLAPLESDQRTVQGHPPQWETFYMDIDQTRDWKLAFDDETVGRFQTPGPLEVVLVLRASLDPRWRQATDSFRENRGADRLRRELNRLHLDQAPRGNASSTVPLGPPHRRRLLAPPWYMDKVDKRARRSALKEAFPDD